MEVTLQNVEILAGYLGNTLNPDAEVRRRAENDLRAIEVNQGYPLVLLLLIQQDAIPIQIRISGAVMLKNFVKRNWQRAPAGEAERVSEADRSAVKEQIVPIMLAAPQAVQRQVGEAISLIGRIDFPEKWPTLLPSLVGHFASGNLALINPVLATADSLFKRYVHEMRSNELWLEIKIVLSQFAGPFTELFKATLPIAKKMVEANATADELRPIFECLSLIVKIFYSLNAQDLPEFFEDNLGIWMPGFQELLRLEAPCLVTDSEEEAGVVEEVRSGICDAITMYAQKYEEELGENLPPFVELVWGLLVSTGPQPKYDLLVANGMSFIASVAGRDQYRSLFQAQGALTQICQSVIVPNMQFRQSDAEAFEENPEEFIRKDIEGSDVDTRRRAAADLVKSLSKFFEKEITAIFGEYIKQLFSEYAADPANNWHRKDVAIYLVTSLAAKGGTSKLGTTMTNQLVNLGEFFRDHIEPELAQPDVNSSPVIKAACLKYLVTFRNQLDKDRLLSGVGACARLASANSVVVHTYAAHALERIFTIRNRENPTLPLIANTDIAPIAQELLTNLFGMFDKPGSRENEYGMKALMRTLVVLGPLCTKFPETIIEKLTAILRIVAANPSKPYFNHYLFESLCVVLKQVSQEGGAETAARFEEALFPPFTDILQKDVTEFMPYCFQILGMMLDLHGQGSGMPESYKALFPFLLMPPLWERHGSVPALVRLLRAYVKVGFAQIAAANQINPILGIFQAELEKLIASRSRDHEGFNILTALLEFGTPDLILPSLNGILTLLFKRLQSQKTLKFVRGFIHFLCLSFIKFGPAAVVAAVDSIQEGLFGMITDRVLRTDMQKISGNLEKKVVTVGVSKLITECSDFYPNGKYSEHWTGLLEGIIGLWELPEEESGEDESQLMEAEEWSGYAAAFSQLAFASAPSSDPTGVPDPKAYLLSQLKTLGGSAPVVALVGKLQPKAQEYLNAYLTAYSISL